MKIFKHIINWVVWTFMSLYAVVMLGIQTPLVQQELGSRVSQALSRQLGTKVVVGRIDLGFLNRLILDDIQLYDQRQIQMLKVTRMTAKVDMASLAIGKIAVSSAQLFGARFHFYKETKDSPANFQFVIDSIASSDTTGHTPLDLRVNSFIMRRCTVIYDQLDEPSTPGKFNPCHLNFTGISAHIILKTLRDDSLNVNVKRLAFIEQSGINTRRLAFQLTAGMKDARIQDFQLALPNTSIAIDSITATYEQKHFMESLKLRGTVKANATPSNFTSLLPPLQNYQGKLSVDASISYEDQTLTVPHLQVISDKNDFALLANGHFKHSAYGKDIWDVNVTRLVLNSSFTDIISKSFTPLPDPVMRLGDIQLKGSFRNDAEGTLYALADMTTGAGSASSRLQLKSDKHFAGEVTTDGVDLGMVLDNEQLGAIATDVEVSGIMESQVSVKGTVSKFEYDGHPYTNIDIDADYAANHLAGRLQINDSRISTRIEANLSGTSLNDAVGIISMNNLDLPEQDYHLDFLKLESGFDDTKHYVTLNSDFAHAKLEGDFDYATLPQSIANAVRQKLPTLPGLPPYKPAENDFTVNISLGETGWLKKLAGIDIDIQQNTTVKATVNDHTNQITVDVQAPSFTYNGSQYQNGNIHITSPSDKLFLEAALSSKQEKGTLFDLKVDGNAADNNLSLSLAWNNNNPQKPFSGKLNATSHLYLNNDSKPEAHVNILPSDVFIDNTVWEIDPSDILYSVDRLLIDHFAVHNGQQYFIADGTASAQKTDILNVNLQNVEIAYILDLVSFDAVSFSGKASGKVVLSSVFDDPDATANLTVNDFKFEDGRMGTLLAQAEWNKRDKQIDIRATSNDGPEAMTFINGYVSPEKDYIDLGLSARGTYLDFMHSFTDSFISHITGHGTGDLRLAGPLSAINLTGNLVCSGEATITPLGTTYQLRNDSLTLIYNEILLDSIAIYDKYDNIGYLSGAIHHQDLTNLSLDLHLTTDKLLGYDFHDFLRPNTVKLPETEGGSESFYGTVYAAGDVSISMKGNDVRINCNVTPLENSIFVYNAAQQDAITNQGFITWVTHEPSLHPSPFTYQQESTLPQESTNIYMDFFINATPNGTLRLLMDPKTGDYITLNGDGALQASYYNKGSFQMQGTYVVSQGTYEITIQNIIKKNFQFQPGGTIVFGGNPYAAALNLQALYTVNGVSLSDLQLGNSFSQNTIRVNCLMNIGGQPAAPQVTFDLDLPNVNADEKQMVRSLLSSQQEMNQQVLYLLGIGRFYSLGQNNATQEPGQQDQTTLAMQSFLSGTLSTQINNVINQIVKNDDWNFGANIATGTEGWNNAEYEGTIAGRMLNNRLLINGQFGYRDNATQASPSFIGDFDVRYLLTPNGNYALKVYNQTNDRYFTRSSLNTQGVGIILKKDFNSLNDFFGIKKKK